MPTSRHEVSASTPGGRPGPSSLTIVLPAFNEAERIGPALDELFEYLHSRPDDGLPARVEVVVVDDGSDDATPDIVTARPEAAPGGGLHLLRVSHGGKGSAVKSGMLNADADIVVFADADMATPPSELPKLVAALESADVALGSRIQPDGSDMRASQPRYRRFLGGAFHLLTSWWVVGDVTDTQCGFKGFSREAAHDLFGRQKVTSIVFDVELIHLARRRGYSVAVVPVRWEDRRGSRMRPGALLAMRVAWDLFRIPLLHRTVRRRR